MGRTVHSRVGVAAGLISILLVTWLAFGCSSGQKTNRTENPFFDRWRDTAETNKGFTPSRKKSTDLSELKKLGLPEREQVKPKPQRPLPNRRITVKLRDVEVSTVLRAVARSIDQNIVINEAIKGTVTVDVKNVPWDQVFTGVLRTQGLAYEWEGDIIRVMKESEKEKATKKEIRTVIIPVEYADAKALKDNIQSVLTIQEGGADGGKGGATEKKTGSVLVDQHNNALIIQASLDDIQRLIPIIEELDRPTSQILIEAHIVEATREVARQLGVQWGGLYHNGNQWIYPGVNSTGYTGNTLNTTWNPTSGFASNFLPKYAQSTAPGYGFVGLSLGYLVGLTGESILSAQLSALATDGVLNILSSPSITTVDNQSALIESGKEVPFQTVDENGKIVIQWKKATLKLEVTPHVVDGQVLKMKIQTKKDELDFTNTVQGNPTIVTKNAETNVVLSDGETTVIGGLNKETQNDTESGIPGLKDIPILGYLFKNDSKDRTMEEVLIFITPYILKEKSPDSNRTQTNKNKK